MCTLCHVSRAVCSLCAHKRVVCMRVQRVCEGMVRRVRVPAAVVLCVCTRVWCVHAVEGQLQLLLGSMPWCPLPVL